MANLVTSFTPGADRNNFTGALGFSFIPTVSISVGSLGVRKATSNTGTRTINLSDAAGTVLTSASVDLTAGIVGIFTYAACTLVTLAAGTTYFLSQPVTSGGQFYSDVGATTVVGAGSVTAVFGSSLSGFGNWTANSQYIGLDLTTSQGDSPTVGALTFTGFAPTFTGAASTTQVITTQAGIEYWEASSPNFIAAQIGVETWAANTPSFIATQIGVEAWRSILDDTSLPSGALVITGFIPTSQLSSFLQTDVPFGTVTISGFSPNLAVNLSPSAGNILLTGFSPNVNVSLSPSIGNILLTGFSPNVNVSLSTSFGNILFTGFSPKLDIDSNPLAGNILFTGFSNVLKFDPTTKDTAVSLLQGNLKILSISGPGGARTIAGQSSGKYYYEMTLITLNNINSRMGIGVVNSIYNDNSLIFVNNTGAISINNIVVGSIGTLSNSDIIGIALDLDNNRIWFRRNALGNWNGNPANDPSNPASGASIAYLIIPGISALPYVFLGATNDQIVANFGNVPYLGARPSNFLDLIPGNANALFSQIGVQNWQTNTPALNVSQTGIESWSSNKPAVNVSQTGIESWVDNTPSVVTSQIGIEVWRSVDDRQTNKRLIFVLS